MGVFHNKKRRFLHRERVRIAETNSEIARITANDLAARIGQADKQSGCANRSHYVRVAEALRSPRSGFTLVELLVVIAIISLISAVTLPVVLPALKHKQVSEAARSLQGALAGARDAALKTGTPSGIRFLPDPAFPLLFTATGIDVSQILAFSRWIPIEAAPTYTTGAVSIYPAQQGQYATAITGGVPAIVAEESLGQWTQTAGGWSFQVGEPSTWAWNVRVGEKIQIGGAGAWYTVCGPVAQPNPEGFVNYGAPGSKSPLARTLTAPDGSSSLPTNPEYLLLVNGVDDNKNGWIDEGYDGVDNNLALEVANNSTQLIDELAEWETEVWLGGNADQVNRTYALERRPVPISGSREVALPTNVVIDASSWATTRSRSRLPVDPVSGVMEILVFPNGSVVPTTRYGVPASVGMGGAFLHFWLAERADVATPPVAEPAGEYSLVTVTARTGRVSSASNPAPVDPFSPAQQGAR
jgi:prepilin-type N-terminal cleavage/methylation domain-containing protein